MYFDLNFTVYSFILNDIGEINYGSSIIPYCPVVVQSTYHSPTLHVIPFNLSSRHQLWALVRNTVSPDSWPRCQWLQSSLPDDSGASACQIEDSEDKK